MFTNSSRLNFENKNTKRATIMPSSTMLVGLKNPGSGSVPSMSGPGGGGADKGGAPSWIASDGLPFAAACPGCFIDSG